MKKSKEVAVSKDVTEAICLADVIFTANLDDLYLHSIVARETSVNELDVLDELDSMFDVSQITSAKSSSVSVNNVDKLSIFASVKERDNELASTFLLDTVIAMTIKISLKYKQDLTCQAVSNYLANQDCYDKWDSKTANVLVKLSSRVRAHLKANNERKRSVLYQSVQTRKRVVYDKADASKYHVVHDIIISDKIKQLVCKSSILS